MSYLVVSPLSRLQETADKHGARHMLTLINASTEVPRPTQIAAADHLFLGFNDIVEPVDGLTPPAASHVEAFLAFARETWPRQSPLLIHCFAGVSRSTAAAYITALALNPDLDEGRLALDLRRAAPSATPNARLIAIADDVLDRDGRMIKAIARIGRGADCFEGTPFVLPIG
jgi:predicted protein tyrosine phosphatase